MKQIPITKISINKSVKRDVMSVIESGALIQGKMVSQFENDFAKYIGVKHAIAVSNGTAALHLALLAMGIGAGDEVITTPFSFIASASSVVMAGARPVFVDIDKNTFNINPSLIESKITKNTKAILPVHLFGQPANMLEILKIAKKHKLMVLEDACQAHGARIKDKKVGSFGDAACFSFYPSKNMFTGEGGMVTTNSSKIANKIKLLRNHGSSKKYLHQIIGYNFRMTDISAVIGINQLKELNKNNTKRIKNATYLSQKFQELDQVLCLPLVFPEFTHVFHQYTVVLKAKRSERVKILEKLQKKGIEARVYYPIPLHKQPALKEYEKNGNYPISEQMAKSVFSLPVHPYLSKSDLDYIIDCIKSTLV